MTPAIRQFLLPFLALITPALGALDFLIRDSAKPGATLIVLATEGDSSAAALRQLQLAKPDRGSLVLARSRPDFQAAEKRDGWESAPDSAAFESRFQDAHQLILSEDVEAYSFDKQFRRDNMWGSSETVLRILTALRGLKSDVVGKNRQALAADGQSRRTIVTTNARLEMEGGLRPSVREREFRIAVAAMQLHLKMTDEGGDKLQLFPAARAGMIRVAVYDGPGAQNGIGRGPAWLRARLARDPGMHPELVGPNEILNGVLDQADVLIIGGGRATLQAEGLGTEGREAVTGVVRNGGGFLGICAGAYLANTSPGKLSYFELLPVETRGTYLGCKSPLVWAGSPVGASRVENVDLNGGPLIKVMEPGSDQITVWARFQRNETSKDKGEHALEGTPAVISGFHGKGKVVLTSTHRERPPSPPGIFPTMVRWCARGVSGDGT